MEAVSLCNVEAEQTVIGSLLFKGELLKDCRLMPYHFSHPAHQAIFKLMREIEAAGEPLDLVTLVGRMSKSALENLGGVSYFVSLAEGVPNLANFSYYEGLVRSGWKMTQAKAIAERMSESLQAERDEALISKAITSLSELEEADETCEFDMRETLIHLYEEFQEDRGELTGISTGFQKLNDMTCGLQEGDFIVIGARPSMGKTAFALNLALHAARSSAAVGLFSLEMSDKQLLKRLISIVGKVSGEKLKNPKHRCKEDDWRKINHALSVIGELPLEIYDKAGIGVRDIYLQTRKLKRKHPGQKVLIIVDYLQLLSGDAKYQGNRMQEMSEISRKLKELARELHVCVLALSQLTRAVESRHDKRPLLSDLRETGQIEQDADVIMMLYREDYYDAATEMKNEVEVHVAKQRNGPVGVVGLRFEREWGGFG